MSIRVMTAAVNLVTSSCELERLRSKRQRNQQEAHMSTTINTARCGATGARGGVRGRADRTGEPGYESARAVYNAMIDRRPALIARCASTAGRGGDDRVRAPTRSAARRSRRRPQRRRARHLRRRRGARPLAAADHRGRSGTRAPFVSAAAAPGARSTPRPTRPASRCRRASSRRPASAASPSVAASATSRASTG